MGLLIVDAVDAGAGRRERCDGCDELIGNHHLEGCIVAARSRDIPARVDQVRELRGRVYLARLRVRRLEGAYPDPAKRNPYQARALAQARTIAAATIWAARHEGVRPFASRGRSHV
jgi:hypothetical protein